MNSKVTKARNYLSNDLEITWDKILPYLEELCSREIKTKEELISWLENMNELEAVLSEDMAWRYIRMSCDTENEKLRNDFEHFATEIEPKIAPFSDQLNKKFANHPLSEQLTEKGFDIYLRGIKSAIEIFREENIDLLSQLQVEAQQFGAISGSLSIEHNGKEYTIQQAANYLKSTDRETRKAVFHKIANVRLAKNKDLDALYSSLIAKRTEVAKNAGFDNFRDYMFKNLGRFDYTVNDCYLFHTSIEKEVVPVLQEFANERKNKLGLDFLKPWDMQVDPEGKDALKPFKGADELVSKSIACFAEVHPIAADCLRTMQSNKLFDLESRKGKAPGGYNYPLAETDMPFIFMNASNSFGDLTTMVHEGGHAVHTFQSAHLPLHAFKNCPSEVAELASMSMELMSMEHWDEFFTDEESLKRAKVEQLKGVIETLPWVAAIDTFQHYIYENPTHSLEERKSSWKEIYSRFGSGFTNWDDLEKNKSYLWQKQLHLYEVPFYYIEYGMAQLGAIAIWKNYKENPEKTVEQYLYALSLGYTKTIPELYAAAGVKFDFSQDYVKELVQFIHSEIKSVSFS